MQFIATSSALKFEKKVHVAKPRLLSLYYEAPQIELTLDEFEMVSLDRLQLLRGIDVLTAKGFDPTEFINKTNELEKKYMLNKKDHHSRLDDVQRDQISHFILRLAYCRTEDLRNWFLKQEMALLKYRLDYLTDLEREAFMHQNGLEFDVVSTEAKNAAKDKLIGLANILPATFIQTTYYKVPFVQALSLIKTREVYLEGGYAWVPLGRLVSIIVTRFRMHLSKALVEASHSFEIVGSDTRIGPLLKNMNKQFVGNDFSKSTQALDKLTPDKVDLAAENDFPLCMKNLHQGLKRESKLKHGGRLQYGLFLKGAGMDLESQQIFWEQMFTKIMSRDQFVKSYAYNIRHMYGKEGARKNYTPFSCLKIIMGGAPETGNYHGCPYKHMNDNSLASMLSGLKIGAPSVKEIMEIAKGGGHYQIACQKHFDITHPGHDQGDAVADHPNHWYLASVNYHKQKNGQPITETKFDPNVSTSTTTSDTTAAATGQSMSGSFNQVTTPSTVTTENDMNVEA